MIASRIKRKLRRIGARAGLWADETAAPGGEQGAGWYDRAYTRAETYHDHYSTSCYYFIWAIITDRILQMGGRRVLEIGCGPGQLAAMLKDQGITAYAGLDFSPVALAMARKHAPGFDFILGDARTSDIYRRFDHDVVICTEVLEHIEDDLGVVSRFLPGKRCLCTVPNFPYDSHVRHFRNAAEVAARYGGYFESFTVMTLKGPRAPGEEFFLFDGVRSGSNTAR